MGWSNTGWLSDDGGWYKNKVSAPAFTTWNPADKDAAIALTGGNLNATRSLAYDGNLYGFRAISSHSSGKFFFSVVMVSNNTNYIGIAQSTVATDSTSNPSATAAAVVASQGGNLFNNGGVGAHDAFTTGDVVDFACDLTTKSFWVRVNGGSWNADPTANPATGVNGIVCSGMSAGSYFPAGWLLVSGGEMDANFGASAYTYAAPSGFGNW